MSKRPDSPDPVEERERARIDAHELSWALRGVNRAAAEVDLELSRRLQLRWMDLAAMNHVMTAPTPLGPLELSHRLGISSGSTTELVDRLEHAGHLQRQRDSQDRRRVSLHPTPRAVTQILSELHSLLTALDALAEEFTADEQAVIARYLHAASHILASYTQRT
jgi:DNA-binding MarR family transcriptional regulator